MDPYELGRQAGKAEAAIWIISFIFVLMTIGIIQAIKDSQVMTKHWLYLKYLVRHKWFVFIAGLGTKAPLWRLVIHDWSKFLPKEWFPYVNYFYGENADENEFDRAWLHHQHLNPHHWQHWVLREDSGNIKVLDMPEHFIREMVADWMGAGRAITGKWEAAEWFKKNEEKIQLSPKTLARVKELLHI